MTRYTGDQEQDQLTHRKPPGGRIGGPENGNDCKKAEKDQRQLDAREADAGTAAKKVHGKEKSRERQERLGNGNGKEIGEDGDTEKDRRPAGKGRFGKLRAYSTDKIANVFHSRVETVFNSGDNFKREGD